MKERLIILFVSVLGLEIAIHSTSLGLVLFKEWYAMIAGLVIVVITMLIHQMGKTIPWFYYLSIGLCMLATGITISAYYSYSNQSISVDDYFLIRMACYATMLMFILISSFNQVKMISSSILTLFVIGVYIFTIMKWANGDGTLYSGLFFYLHIMYFNIIALIFILEKKEMCERYLSFAGFGAYMIVGFITLLIISEGEVLEGLGAVGVNGNKKQDNIS